MSSNTHETLLTMGQIAEKLNCSERHLRRLRAAGGMPAPVAVGSLERWRERVVDRWIAQGCPAQAGEGMNDV